MTIADFSRDAVRNYLRSVVLIDDDLFKHRSRIAVAGEPVIVDAAPSLVMNGGDAPTDVEHELCVLGGDARRDGTVRSADVDDVDVRAVTDGFADEGIVCGVYKPRFFPEIGFENDKNFTTLLKICINADVFILDWQLFPDGNEAGVKNDNAVASLLKHILNDENGTVSPKPVRFCAIYTAGKVDTVCDNVFSALKQVVGSEAHQDRDALKVCAEGLTVYIYAKEVATSSVASGAIAAKDLAGRIISDFAKTYEGILPGLALRGIASIRNNAKRILDKFPAGMDPALLVHAGLTLEDLSVSDDVSVLLSDEMKSVLFDMGGSGDEVYGLLIDALKGVDASVFSTLASNTALVKDGVVPMRIKEYLLTSFGDRKFGTDSPFTERCYDCESHKASKELLDELQTIVVKIAAGKGQYKAGSLSKLFCQRTLYSEERVLKSGTVVRDVKTGTYYVCMMPLCDSLRLTGGKTAFPFWKLSNAKDHKTGKAHAIVVDDHEGNVVRLCLKGKIRDRLTLWRFKSESVASFVKEGNGYVISECPKWGTVSGKQSPEPSKFEWVAELKPFHAQRMAEHVSREFSRVGLTESEWLRLQVDR